MPQELDKLKDAIWDNLRGKINPRTRKKYTESEAFAIATARLKDSKQESSDTAEFEQDEPSELLSNAIREMEG